MRKMLTYRVWIILELPEWIIHARVGGDSMGRKSADKNTNRMTYKIANT